MAERTCANCGAWEGIHNGETDQCPMDGVEQTPGRPQRYANTKFLLKGSNDDLKGRIEVLERRVTYLEKSKRKRIY